MSQTLSSAPTLAQRVIEWAQPITAYLVLGSFAAALALAYITKDAEGIRGMSSAVQTLASIVVGYYFGSSRSSQKKDDTIANQLPAPAPAQTSTTGATP